MSEVSFGGLIASLTCLLLAFSVRKETYVMVLPFIILAWIVKLYQNRDNRKKVIRVGATYILSAIVLAGGIQVIHKLADREQFFNDELIEFSTHRNNIRDYDGVPDYDMNAEFYQSIGVTREEYSLIRYQMITMDFSTDIKEIAKELYHYNIWKKNYIELKDKLWMAKEKFLNVYDRVLIKPQIFIVMVTAFGLGIYFLFYKKWVWFLFMLLGWLGAGAEMFCLLYKGRLNERVVKSLVLIAVMWMFAVFLQAMYHDKDTLPKHKGRIQWLSYGLMLVYLCTFVFQMIPAIDEKQGEYEQRYQQSILVNDYCAQHSNNIYFSCYAFLSGDTNKLGNKYDNRFNNRIRIGLIPFTTTYYESLERAGIKGSEEEAITMQDNVFLMGENVEGQLPELDRYFKRKYGEAYSYEVVDILNDSIYVWKVHLEEE